MTTTTIHTFASFIIALKARGCPGTKVDKHKADKDDAIAMFYLFPSPEEEEKMSKQLGKLADGSVPVEELGRYWKLSYNKDPKCITSEDNISHHCWGRGIARIQE